MDCTIIHGYKMKLLYLFLFFNLCFLYHVYPDQTLYTEDGRKVILYDNGTWEYAAVKKELSKITLKIVEIRKLNLFPERYVGEKIAINGIWLTGQIEKDGKYYCIGIFTDTGERFYPYILPDSITFILPLNLAETWLEYNKDDNSYQVNIEGELIKMKHEYYDDCWAFFIKRFHTLTISGNIAKIFE